MSFQETLSGFFADFAVQARYNDLESIAVIFEKAYLEPMGNSVEGAAPVAWVESALIPAVKQGDTLAVEGEVYVVRGVEPDGVGITLLRLEEQ